MVISICIYNFITNNKNLHPMNFVNAFQKIALSLGVLFFGIGVFIYSISPAQADNPTATDSTGKIMMSESGFVLGFFFSCLNFIF